MPETVKMSKVAVASKKSKKAVPEVGAKAFLYMARQYHAAAEELFAGRERRISSGSQPERDDPIYFLYYHAIELAFKAYRRAHNLPNEETHSLKKLYQECQELKLVIGPEFHIQNLVNLLESGSKEYLRFRYFSLKSSSLPEFAWIREGVGAMMQTISDKIHALFPLNSQPSRAVKMTVSWSKPVKKREPNI
jgi:hypothetical protein